MCDTVLQYSHEYTHWYIASVWLPRHSAYGLVYSVIQCMVIGVWLPLNKPQNDRYPGYRLGLPLDGKCAKRSVPRSTTMYPHRATYVICAAAPATRRLRCLSHPVQVRVPQYSPSNIGICASVRRVKNTTMYPRRATSVICAAAPAACRLRRLSHPVQVRVPQYSPSNRGRNSDRAARRVESSFLLI